jgi:hypothetical protein
MRTRITTAILVASLLAGCSGEIISDSSASVIVYGRVSADQSPTPPRALMSLSAYANGSCDGPLLAAANAVTTEAGDYRAALSTFGAKLSTCISVTAQPQEASGLSTASEQRAPVEMRSGAPDSIRVDVELQPTP